MKAKVESKYVFRVPVVDMVSWILTSFKPGDEVPPNPNPNPKPNPHLKLSLSLGLSLSLSLSLTLTLPLTLTLTLALTPTPTPHQVQVARWPLDHFAWQLTGRRTVAGRRGGGR